MKYQYKYCSNCGELFDKKSEILFICPKCDFRIFVSPKPAVGALIFNNKGELLMLRRSINPGKGMLGIPGGFINSDESGIDALNREVFEEIGLTILDFKYFGTFFGNYEYKYIVYKTVDFIYYAYINENHEIKMDLNESSEYLFIKPKNIDINQIGTEDVKKAVIELIQSKLH